MDSNIDGGAEAKIMNGLCKKYDFSHEEMGLMLGLGEGSAAMVDAFIKNPTLIDKTVRARIKNILEISMSANVSVGSSSSDTDIVRFIRETDLGEILEPPQGTTMIPEYRAWLDAMKGVHLIDILKRGTDESIRDAKQVLYILTGGTWS